MQTLLMYLFLKGLLLFYVFACIYVCLPHACLVLSGDQKRAPDSLSLELQLVVSQYWMLGVESGSLQDQQDLVTSESSLQQPTSS